jgi:phosphate-selective porin OprO/OprP
VVADLTHRAWHATLSFVIAGKTAYDGPVPSRPYRTGSSGWGALELAIRVSHLKLDPDTFPQFGAAATSPREATGYGLALSWYLSRNARASVHYERTAYKGAPSPPRTHEDALIARAQVTF